VKKAFPQNEDLPALFKPLTLRNVTFPNRIFVAPMCQYSSDNGHATDWHLVHLGVGRSALAHEGRSPPMSNRATLLVDQELLLRRLLPLSQKDGSLLRMLYVLAYLSRRAQADPYDLQGLWTDSQIAPLKRVVDFCHTQGTKIGVQLAHAGRKASTYAPWVHADAARNHVADTYTASEEENGWPKNVYGPSAIPYSDRYPMPKEMTEQDMQYVEDAFVAATERSKAAGFDFIQNHFAHGYLYVILYSAQKRGY
jgi:2,4-dienoyl-CoA reductase-like NADH-dependent reductase (Old Yellow Enzyme family)